MKPETNTTLLTGALIAALAGAMKLCSVPLTFEVLFALGAVAGILWLAVYDYSRKFGRIG